MTPPYVRACVRAEIKRALRAGRAIDRQGLKRETGLLSSALERLISRLTVQMVAESLTERFRRKSTGE